jgi:protein-L-isoaspartate(D-aspartate) O-methyltransferase
VAAAAPRIPEQLTAQLAPGGRLVIPVGDLATQELVILERPTSGERLVQRQAGGVRFVPLISRFAFTEEG